jgi:hypothetical protein
MPDENADWSFDGCRHKLREATRIVLDAEAHYDRSAQRAADAEAVYRRELAVKFKAHREAGQAVEAASTLARSDVATLSRERDYSRDLVKLAAEKLEDARDSRRSLWRLIEWARGRDLAQAGPAQQEPDARMGR